MDSCCPFLRQLAADECGLSRERIIGEILQKGSRSYQLISCTWNTGDLVVFSVIVLDAHPEYADLRDRPLEAQAFWKHHELPPKLYESRKRRIRRLRNSRNFVDDFENERLRVVVCQSPNEGIGRHCKQQGAQSEEPSLGFRDADFPPLGQDISKWYASTLDTSRCSVPTYARIAETSCQQACGASCEPLEPPRETKLFTRRKEIRKSIRD